MIKSKLKINDDKTELLIISSPYSKFSKDIQLSIGQVEISPSSAPVIMLVCLIAGGVEDDLALNFIYDDMTARRHWWK